MRIIKDKLNKDEEMKTRRITCESCGSILEAEISDVKIGNFGLSYVICPVCGCQTLTNVDDWDETITIDSLVFPEHFYYFGGEGSKSINADEITSLARKGIEYFRENPQEFAWFTARGDTAISVWNMYGDEDYTVRVSKGYYEVEVPYEPIDYELNDELDDR